MTKIRLGNYGDLKGYMILGFILLIALLFSTNAFLITLAVLSPLFVILIGAHFFLYINHDTKELIDGCNYVFWKSKEVIKYDELVCFRLQKSRRGVNVGFRGGSYNTTKIVYRGHLIYRDLKGKSKGLVVIDSFSALEVLSVLNRAAESSQLKVIDERELV